MTQAVTISAGNTPIIRYLPGTRYADSALSDVQDLIAAAFRPILGAELHHRGDTQISAEGDAGDAHWDHVNPGITNEDL